GQAVVRQSAAPMTRKTRRLPVVQPAGTSIVRAYQAMEALSGTPESGLPQGNGTTIARGAGSSLRDHPWASPTSCPSNWNCHDPFRFCHSSRWKSGRGCSARGILTPCPPLPSGEGELITSPLSGTERGTGGEDHKGRGGTRAATTTAISADVGVLRNAVICTDPTAPEWATPSERGCRSRESHPDASRISPCWRNSGPSFRSSSVPRSQLSVGEEIRTRLLLIVHGSDMRAMYRCCGVRSVAAFASQPDHTAYSWLPRRVTVRSIAQIFSAPE